MPASDSIGGAGQRGQIMLALLVAAILVTVISVSLVSIMNTDMSHASIQYAVARSYYIAQAGLEEAKAHIATAADPAADATPPAGVTAPYGGGQFTYWVDAGPATGCEPGLKTLEALGQVAALGRRIPARVQACAAPGAPAAMALFAVSRVEFQGASRTYLAPYEVGSPGGGGNLGTFTEINFAGNDVRLNALSDDATALVTLREGTFADYTLFGFSERPQYNATPTAEPTPWILGVTGDLIKAQPPAGLVPTPCGGPGGCVTVGNKLTDVPTVADLREANYQRHVYMRGMRAEIVAPLSLDPAGFQRLAEQNTANAALNRLVGLAAKTDSHYALRDIYRIMVYVSTHPGQYLQGTIYVDGNLTMIRDMDLGGPTGNVTLAVAGDLIIGPQRALTNRHDLTTVPGRRTPAIVVLGAPRMRDRSTPVCGGNRVSGSGRLVMCDGSTLVVDGMIYTQDGMAVGPKASVDQVGAMYHNNRGTPSPGFTTRDATVVLRFDPLALAVFGKGAALLSWQQLP
jgi:hypothetical protein